MRISRNNVLYYVCDGPNCDHVDRYGKANDWVYVQVRDPKYPNEARFIFAHFCCEEHHAELEAKP